MYQHGWFQLAFDRELSPGLTGVAFANRRLMIVKTDDDVAVYDATCPHRGAHLVSCGRLDGNSVICGFHGNRIALGDGEGSNLWVNRYPSRVHNGVVWVGLAEDNAVDLLSALERLDQGQTFVPGFELEANTSVEIVIENGFDASHFPSVHGLSVEPKFTTSTGPDGELSVDGVFEFGRSHWNQDQSTLAPVRVNYHGSAYSPGVFIASLSGEPPFNYSIITTATPMAGAHICKVRVTLVLPNGSKDEPPDQHFVDSLLAASRDGLLKDRAIWNELDLGLQCQHTAQDHAAIKFHEFCARFRSTDAGG